MNRKLGFLKPTLIGGLIFLIPFVVIVAVIGKALTVMVIFAEPFAKLLPFETVAGIAIVNILELLALILICFFAGLLADSSLGRRAFTWLDVKLMAMIPGYAFVKGLAGSIEQENEKKGLLPVLVKLDDQAQVGFEIERLANGLVVVFLPSSPDVWSGAVVYIMEERIEMLDADFATVSKTLRTLGRGSNQLIRTSA